jgi:AraC family transcriptional regulator
MFLRLENLPPTKLRGLKIRTCQAKNQTFELWNNFMPKVKEIKNRVNSNLISMQKFDEGQKMIDFKLTTEYDKWAAVEVRDFNSSPHSMQEYNLQGGLYAVFLHKGAVADFAHTQKFIYAEWLPISEYELDDREHLQVMGNKYINNSSDSEEEVWVPVKSKDF